MKMVLIAFVSLSFVFSLRGPENKIPDEKYNIVLFIADDLSASDIQPYGNKVVRTPNLQKLSMQSLLFKQAFASSPTCTPSRSSMYTGLMPLRHGAHGNHGGVAADTRSLVHYLQPLNYTVAIAGKLHVGPAEVFPFGRISKTNVPEPGFEKKPGLNYDLQLGPVDKWLSARQKDKPFMLIVADHSPHVVWPETATYDPAKVNIPAKHIDTKETRKARARYYTDVTKMDNNVGVLLKSLDRNGLSKNTIVIFVADQGAQWPFAKWSLYEDGIRVPMMIRWPGVVKGASQTNALVSLVDLLPTLIEAAGGNAPAGIDGQSFLPVLKGQTQTHREFIFATHTGDGLMNRAPERMVRSYRYKYILNLAPEYLYTTHIDKAKDHDGGHIYWASWLQRSFADPHAASTLWRYHNRPKEELYDMEKDPNEWKNLVSAPAYAAVLEKYRSTLANWRLQQKDTVTTVEQIKPRTPGEKPVAPYVFTE